MITLSIKDEHPTGKLLSEVMVAFNRETVTVKDIIEARVRQEVENYLNKLPEYYNGLIEPTDAEKTINGYKLRDRKPIDAEKQVYTALNAFQKNGFFILVDNDQCMSLDQTIVRTDRTNVSFIKLTPIIGG